MNTEENNILSPQLALEVISKEEFTYANSSKTAYTDYVIRTEKGIVDEITGINNLFEENDVPVIMCRIPTDSILNTEFYVSKYNFNSLTEIEKLNEIEKNKSGKIEITDIDLLSQIKGNINWYNKNERIDAAINLIKEKYHTAEGREYLQEINSYDYKEKEHLVDNVLGMLKEHYNEEKKLITLETSKDDTQTIENLYTAEDLEILIKARDAFKYGVDSLEFTRPNAEQINMGIETEQDFDILTKGYDIFGSLEGYNLNGKKLQNISNIERIDVMEVFASDDDAAKQYEFDNESGLLKKGRDIWIGDNDVEFYSIPDTHENLQKFLQEVEFKKDKGIKNDSQVLENPTNERSSLPNKNIQDIDSDVNKISENNVSYMPERNVINRAKAARAQYCVPILKGEKKGLWKAFNDFKRHGVFEIQGKNVATDKNGHLTENGFKQLATAMDIYRDKRFESARYVFIDKEGNIKDQLALSTFMPNRSISKLDETFEQVLKHAQETDTKVAFVHNHPSGNIEASLDDKRFTSNLEEYLNRNGKDLFAGHIILDHNSFNCYEPGKQWKDVHFANEVKDSFAKDNIPDFAKTKIDSIENLKSVAKSINDENEYNKNWIPVVFVKADASIGGIEYFSKDYFTQNKSEDISQDFQNLGRLCGSDKAIPVVPNELSYDEKLHSEIINKFRDGCFFDVALGNRTAKDLNLEEFSSALFNYTNKEMQQQTKIETTFELPKVDKREIGISQKIAENQTFYKRENIQPVDLRSYIDKSKSNEIFNHKYFVEKKFVPPFVFAEDNCYIRCNAKDLKINSALKLNPEKKVDVILSKKQFAQIIADEKLKEKISKLEDYKKNKKPITPIEVASSKMTEEQEALIIGQTTALNHTDRKIAYNSMYLEVMSDVGKIEKERVQSASEIIKRSDLEFEQLKNTFTQQHNSINLKKAMEQGSAIDY